MKPWMIWDIEHKHEKRERAEEVGRAIYAPPPPNTPPPGWKKEKEKKR